MSFDHYYQNFLTHNPYPRQLKNYEPADDDSSQMHVNYEGKKLINFSSSDYLGLTKHPLLIERSQHYAKNFGVGSASSRLVSGNFSFYESLEKKLASALNKPAALILGAGYQANTTILEALLDPAILKSNALVFCDRLCHHSLLSTPRYLADLKRFQHNDLNHLTLLLEKYSADPRPKFIIVESIYSMDGDQVDLERLIQIAKQYRAFLYVDDAHAVGVYGSSGFGLASDFGADIDMIMGTFSKGLGSYGAYVGCSSIMRDYLINKCKGLIYSTGPSPAVMGAIDGALEILPQLTQQRERINKHATTIRHYFKTRHLNYGCSNTHIIPWIIGSAEETLEKSLLLEEQGILATPIRPPSVPVSQSRIRFCITAAHSEGDIQQLIAAIHHVK